MNNESDLLKKIAQLERDNETLKAEKGELKQHHRYEIGILKLFFSKTCTEKERLFFGIPAKKGKNEDRDFEICFECNQVGCLWLDGQGNACLSNKGTIERQQGAGWHKEGGVYSIVGEKFNLSPCTIEKIYNSPNNTQHHRLTKPCK